MNNHQQDQASWEWMQLENEMRLAACIGQEGKSEERHLALIDADMRYMNQVDEHLLQAKAKPSRVITIRKTTDWRV